jgi:GTP-binding protein HflX
MKQNGRPKFQYDASQQPPESPERVLLVGIQWPGQLRELVLEYMDELDMLAQTSGADVVGRELVGRRDKDPALLIGKGKAAELAELVEETRTELVIFDDDLSPAQARNLENIFKCRVMDRTGLILDIFALRARSREAKTQVELAQLAYVLPRLTRAWTHLERQQGGIGMRGPGETQIETDRRLIRDRMSVLKDDLAHIDRIRETQRSGREAMFRFALAGYTNVGKSTLMNALTKAGVYEENLLFATLDSTTRLLELAANERVLLTDTVGFIRKLPTSLVASFRSTLAEIKDADCIIHLVDLASPAYQDQMHEVEKILAEMGLKDRTRLLIFNKVDALADDEPLRSARAAFPEALFISARQGVGVGDLVNRMHSVYAAQMVELSLHVPYAEAERMAELHRVANVVGKIATETGLDLRVRMPLAEARRMGLADSK